MCWSNNALSLFTKSIVRSSLGAVSMQTLPLDQSLLVVHFHAMYLSSNVVAPKPADFKMYRCLFFGSVGSLRSR